MAPAVKQRVARHALRWGLAVGILLHIGVALCWMRALPLFNWPDEPAHFNYIKRLADGRGFDVMTDEVWAPVLIEKLRHDHFRSVHGANDPTMAPFCSEAHQPPVYYLAGAAVYRLTHSAACLKLFNLMLSCLGIFLVYRIAIRLFPDTPLIPIGAVLLLALQPMRAFMAVSISNDPAAECAFSAALLLMLQRRSPWLIGLAAGLGFLTKIHLLLIPPLYLLWMLMDPAQGRTLRSRSTNRAVWIRMAVAGMVCLLMALPWLWRNMSLYGLGDPLALGVGALGSRTAEKAALGQIRPVLGWTGSFGIITFMRILFQSWWGVFGWMEWFMNTTWVMGFLVLSLTACGGLWRAVLTRCKTSYPLGERAYALLWLACGWLAFLLALFMYSLSDFQAQGRYLLVASSAAGILFSFGLFSMLRRWMMPGLALTGVFLLSANLYMALCFIPMHLH